jgi:hypothetical protein
VKLANGVFPIGTGSRRLGHGFSALVVLVLAMCTGPVALAQAQTVERSAKGSSGKDIRIGVYVNVQPDCSSGPLPAIRLLTPPANGTINIKRGKVSATNYKQCLALEVPGFVALYRSKPNFSGTDVVMLEVKYADNRTQVQRITVTVGDGKTGREI